MKPGNKRLIKTLLFLFSLGFFGFVMTRIFITQELPVYEGTVPMTKIKDTVEVFTDQFGVPHVFANNEEDLFLAAGYIAARERLFQMSMVLNAVRGELASMLGDEYLSADIYLRTWRIHDISKKITEKMDLETKKIMEAFCQGINLWIDETSDDLPLEFRILGIKPQYWKPSDVVGYARMMAHELQSSWKAEIIYGAVAQFFGMNKLAEIYPGYSETQPTISEHLKKEETKLVYNKILENEFFIRDILHFRSPEIGSNSWVLSGALTETGKPLLANDPHLDFTQPARWYEMHLKGGRFNVSGVCIAGIPVPIIGQNETCAWGFTNSMVDDVDFFVETMHPDNPNKYKKGKEWLDVELIKETIPLKEGADTTVVIRMTHHGPIISDIHPLLKGQETAVSIAWTGHWITSEIDGFFKLNLMKDWEDFTEATSLFGVPGQNMIYADVHGNIGWRPAVYIPLRKKGESLIPRPGHDPTYDWFGKVPFVEMPYLLNPEEGYIVTANNKIIDDTFQYYISGLWADPSRAKRILERVQSLDNATVQDMKSIQLDVTSHFAREITPYFLATEAGTERKNLKKAYGLLKKWKGEESTKSAAALLFHSAINKLIRNIYGDEMALLGNHYLEAFIGLKYLHSRNLRDILKKDKSSWFDDIRTAKHVESRDEILKRSLEEAVNELEDRVGPNPNSWEWGNEHSLTHPHVFGKIKILNWLFKLNVGPFLSGGSDKTPNAGGYSFNKPFKQTAGASMRRIVDFSNLNRTNMVLPTGQSGLYNSPHYRDQAKLYHFGRYRITTFDEKFIRESDNYKRLVLVPDQ